MPSINQSYAGMEAGVYFFKPAHDLQIGKYISLVEQGYERHMAKDGKHIYLLFLKVKK